MINTIDDLTISYEATLLAFFAANTALSYFSSAFLQSVWGVVNSLQLILITVMFTVKIPKNAEVFMIQTL